MGTKAESNALRGLSMDSKGVTQPGLERTSCGDFQTGQFVRGTRVLPRGLRHTAQLEHRKDFSPENEKT